MIAGFCVLSLLRTGESEDDNPRKVERFKIRFTFVKDTFHNFAFTIVIQKLYIPDIE